MAINIEHQPIPTFYRLAWPKPVSLLLGTDHHIDEGLETEECRVGITPDQVSSLFKSLDQAGLKKDKYFNSYMVAGAGEGAGFTDAQYKRVGCKIVERDNVGRKDEKLNLDHSPDVVHALKEPGLYESSIRGPFMRIGAVHSAGLTPRDLIETAPKEQRGLSELLRNGNCCAIFDGSEVGGYSHRTFGGHTTPIRGGMSEIAGQKAVEKVMEYYALRRICPSKIIISGAGAVGSSVVRKLVEISTDSIKFDIKVIDPDESKSGIFKTLNRSQCKIEVVTADKITEYDLSGADALILAAYIKGRPAPKVVSCHELRQMKDYAIIVDVAIDEGSGIDGVPPLQKDESRDAAVKSFIQSKLQEKHLNVIADSHLPRLSPAEASITHGNNVLPYLAVLLYLSAKEGGAISAVRYLHREVRKRIDASASSDASDSMFGELDFDLLNGLAYIVHDGYIVDCRGHLAKRSVHDLMEISLGGILEHPQITRLNPGT